MSARFQNSPDVFLMETTLPGEGPSLSFEGACEVITAWQPEDLGPAFKAMEAARAEGKWLAGFLSYEAGYALEPALQEKLPQNREVPLLWFTVYEQAVTVPLAENHKRFARPKPVQLSHTASGYSQQEYEARIERVLAYIRAGDIYQANFSFQSTYQLEGAVQDLYAYLRRRQPVAFSTLIESKDWALLSLSPELFFETESGKITSRPMKGTVPRSPWLTHDDLEREDLQSDPKQRAENLMIVDLIRNDIARISKPGTVNVPEIFKLETYRTLHTMTSTVTAELCPETRLEDHFRALFPCGSVTGAPKIRAMEVLRELEDTPRGVYTGAIGYIAPEGKSCFNVAIRTLFLNGEGTNWTIKTGVGGGIVHDSTPEGEWQECATKLAYLNLDEETPEDFELIETLRWSAADGFDHLDLHLQRLATSAQYFAFLMEEEEIRKELDQAVGAATAPQHMVRLLLARSGAVSVELKPLADNPARPWIFELARTPVQTSNTFLYHKTTRREVYTRALAEAGAEADEVLLFNEDGHLTEGTRTNLFVELDGQLYTPPLEDGLLPGTLRQHMLEQGEALEKSLTLQDLRVANQIFLGNSVRGMIPATQSQEIRTEAGE